MKVVVISGSPRKTANTQYVMNYVYEYTKTKNQDTKLINLSDGQVECYRGPDEDYNQATIDAANSLMDADVWLIGTPIYNSFFSSALKNLFEYVNYKKTEGKVAGMAILAAGQIGFIDVQTLLTQLLSYFRIITNPKAVFLTTESISENSVSDTDAQDRLKQMVDETLEIASKLRK
ncbi:NADPH-dependent FMN reductase [Nitrosopumilus sp.]|uniref:NADPH-dependent FMN reductase n=1 Tax=Nitrosopumilus sp. TaxID=2024843 RepID=UPI0026018D47|nr:NADPH-dependent FMN reductase [Nitrosopumilus sp.]